MRKRFFEDKENNKKIIPAKMIKLEEVEMEKNDCVVGEAPSSSSSRGNIDDTAQALEDCEKALLPEQAAEPQSLPLEDSKLPEEVAPPSDLECDENIYEESRSPTPDDESIMRMIDEFPSIPNSSPDLSLPNWRPRHNCQSPRLSTPTYEEDMEDSLAFLRDDNGQFDNWSMLAENSSASPSVKFETVSANKTGNLPSQLYVKFYMFSVADYSGNSQSETCSCTHTSTSATPSSYNPYEMYEFSSENENDDLLLTDNVTSLSDDTTDERLCETPAESESAEDIASLANDESSEVD